MSGWSRKSGRSSGCGGRVRIAGTAPVVHSCTVVVFRYQVASSGEPGEVGVADGVDRLVVAHERDDGELVEDDHDDRVHPARRLGELRLGRAREQEPRDRREEEEEARGRERRGAEDGQEHPRRSRARVEDGRRRPRRRRRARRGQRARRRRSPRIAWRTRSPTRAATKTRWSTVAARALPEPGERLEPEEDERREHDEPDGEEDDVPAREEPRTAKNSTLCESRSKSGWATARADSPARWSAGAPERSRRVRRPESHGRGCASRRAGSRGARLASGRTALARRRRSRSRGWRPGALRARSRCTIGSSRVGNSIDDLGPEPGEPVEERRAPGRCSRARRGGRGRGRASGRDVPRSASGRALLAAPAEAGGGVGQVADEREDRLASPRRGARGRAPRPRPRRRRRPRCSRPRAPRCACSGRRCSRGPRRAAAAQAGRLADERLLGGRVGLVVGVVARRSPTTRSGPGSQLEPLDELRAACGRSRGSARRGSPPSSGRSSRRGRRSGARASRGGRRW